MLGGLERFIALVLYYLKNTTFSGDGALQVSIAVAVSASDRAGRKTERPDDRAVGVGGLVSSWPPTCGLVLRRRQAVDLSDFRMNKGSCRSVISSPETALG